MRVILVALMLTLTQAQTVPATTTAAVNKADTPKAKPTSTVAKNAPSAPAQNAPAPNPQGSTASDTETSKREKAAATKLGVELAKWGKLDVEGLSQNTLTWIVCIIVGAVLIACCIGIFVEKKSSHDSKAPVAAVIVLSTVAGLAAYFLFRARLQPFVQAESVVLTSRNITDNISASLSRHADEVARLEKALAAANERLQSTSATQASLDAAKERLRERERELETRRRQADAAILQSEDLRRTIERQREELLRVRYDRSVLWMVSMVGTALFALAAFFVFIERQRRRYEAWHERQTRREWEARQASEASQPAPSHIVIRSARGELRVRGVPLSPELVLRLLRDVNDPLATPERTSG